MEVKIRDFILLLDVLDLVSNLTGVFFNQLKRWFGLFDDLIIDRALFFGKLKLFQIVFGFNLHFGLKHLWPFLVLTVAFFIFLEVLGELGYFDL